jgi:DNA-binding Lrp family transcriptional regulator
MTGGERPEATRAQAAVLASAVRLRIIRLTYDRGLTNKEIADRLGKDPATTLYHVRRLVEHGFLVAEPARSGARGAKEIPYRSTGLSWRLRRDRQADVEQAMLEAYLGELADVGPADLDQSRFVMRLDDAGRAELKRRIRDLLQEYADRPGTPGGELTALYVAIYPGE